MTLTEAFRRYPIKNPRWNRHENSFSTFASDHKNIHMTDPWNRDIFTGNVAVNRDPEGDVTDWVYRTTVAGNMVELTVFND